VNTLHDLIFNASEEREREREQPHPHRKKSGKKRVGKIT
jgi:hypothetical protein